MPPVGAGGGGGPQGLSTGQITSLNNSGGKGGASASTEAGYAVAGGGNSELFTEGLNSLFNGHQIFTAEAKGIFGDENFADSVQMLSGKLYNYLGNIGEGAFRSTIMEDGLGGFNIKEPQGIGKIFSTRTSLLGSKPGFSQGA